MKLNLCSKRRKHVFHIFASYLIVHSIFCKVRYGFSVTYAFSFSDSIGVMNPSRERSVSFCSYNGENIKSSREWKKDPLHLLMKKNHDIHEVWVWKILLKNGIRWSLSSLHWIAFQHFMTITTRRKKNSSFEKLCWKVRL